MQEAFKYYKNKTKEPDLSRVIDCTSKDDDKVNECILEILSDNLNLAYFSGD